MVVGRSIYLRKVYIYAHLPHAVRKSPIDIYIYIRIYSFIHSGDLYSASSWDCYSRGGANWIPKPRKLRYYLSWLKLVFTRQRRHH